MSIIALVLACAIRFASTLEPLYNALLIAGFTDTITDYNRIKIGDFSAH